jgi:mRNA interferase RelE/StbE
LEKTEKNIRKRIYNKIISTKEDPFRFFFERLTGKNEFKLRIGDYRVVADIDETTQRISILVIGHRKNIYEKF